MHRINLKSLSKDELLRFVSEHGLPPYRADQLLHWIYKKYAAGLDEITEFSLDLRDALGHIAYVGALRPSRRLKSADGTEKFLFALEDGETVESVLIPDGGRLTLCISSQVGCAMGCLFCLTGRCGLVRNLKAYEIVDQVLTVNRILRDENSAGNPAGADLSRYRGPVDKKVTNIVFMGMGEPLANFDEVVEAIIRITSLLGISKRRITLSTAGIVPKMLLLPKKAPGINLAVSLNATTDEMRNEIMPITRRYPIRSLINACKKYPLSPGRRITFEYVLIAGKNDSPEDARSLVKLIRGIRCKINLIPLNSVPEMGLERPADERVLEFQQILLQNRVRSLIRESRGQDILAACGQLRGRDSKRRAMSPVRF